MKLQIWAGVALVLSGFTASAVISQDLTAHDLNLWARIKASDFEGIENREVSLKGTVLAYATGSVFLLPRMPPVEDGSYVKDSTECIGLIVSADQFRSLTTGDRISVTGELMTFDMDPSPDVAITHLVVRGRTVHPDCMSEEQIAPLIFVTEVRRR